MQVNVKNSRIHYQLELDHRITIITGNSGTNKTQLCAMVNKNSPTTYMSHKMRVITDTVWELLQVNNIFADDIIYLVDEDFKSMQTKEFADFVKNTNNYFILIFRDKLPDIPYGIDNIKELKKQGRLRILKNHFDLCKYYEPLDAEQAIIEDSTSGYNFFRELLNIPIISSYGKDNIIKKLEELNHKKLLIIVDECGFGHNIEAIRNECMKCANNYQLLGYQSFEEYLCTALGINTEEVKTNKCTNEEVFYEELIKDYTEKNYGKKYNKKADYNCFDTCYRITCDKRSSNKCNITQSAKEIHLKTKYCNRIKSELIN